MQTARSTVATKNVKPHSRGKPLPGTYFHKFANIVVVGGGYSTNFCKLV